LIRVEQLSPDESFELASVVPGAENLPEELVWRAVRSADGVPLFVEQLVLSLVEQGTRNTSGGRKSSNLPLILAEMLSERLDRRPGARRIVQAVACLGRSFSPDSLAAILEVNVAFLSEQLDLLVDAEILQPTRYGVELRYEFRHALLQLMALESMVATERRGMHARIAEFLETTTNLPSPPEESAYHLTEAGLFIRAIQRWLAAGLNAARQSTHREAIDHLRKGLDLLDNVHDSDLRRDLEIGLQAALMSSLAVTQFATSFELSACCERGIELCRGSSQTSMVFPFVFGQFTFANCCGRAQEAMALADMFVSLAEENQYGSGVVIGHRLRGMCLLGQGRLNEAKSELNLSLAFYSDERDAASVERFGQNPKIHTQSLLALALFCLGEVQQALALGRDVLHSANTLRDPHSAALALSYIGGLIFGYCGASRHLAAHAKRLCSLCEQHKLGGYRPHALAFLGWAECQVGQLEPGVAKIRAAVQAFDSVGYKLSVAAHLCNLADGLRRLGRLAEAKAASARAGEMTVTSAAVWLEPEIRRLDALIDFELALNDPSQAIQALEKAPLRALQMETPVFERRCLLTLREIGGHSDKVDVKGRLSATAQFSDLGGLVENVIEFKPLESE
jgi:tetratricopeptide (TPR) repeat protein